MNEHCLRVVISGPGEQQVQLRLAGASSDRQVVLQVAPLGALTLARREGSTSETRAVASNAPLALSLELRWSEPAPARVEPPPLPREPAPLAMAWAMAQRLRQRQPSSVPPRRRSTHDPG
jgi:hypothetical protein